jgi:hypothetical protein
MFPQETFNNSLETPYIWAATEEVFLRTLNPSLFFFMAAQFFSAVWLASSP